MRKPEIKYVMLCAICYHLYNLSSKVLKVTLIPGCFSRFLNCINGTKSLIAFRMLNKCVKYVLGKLFTAQTQLLHIQYT